MIEFAHALSYAILKKPSQGSEKKRAEHNVAESSGVILDENSDTEESKIEVFTTESTDSAHDLDWKIMDARIPQK